MSTSTQVTTFADLFTDLQNRVRQQTGVTASQNIAKRLINVALHDMHIGFGERFSWAERQATLVTQPEYTTGTVAITKGATALVGTSSLWNTANAFGVNNMRTTGKIVINGGPEVYDITTVASDTSITLASRFVGETVTAASYSYFEDEYDLHADFLRPFDQRSFDSNREIVLIGRREFRQRYPRNKTPGKPVIATMVDRAFSGNTTPVRRIMFHKPPDQEYLIPYNFVTNKLAVSASGVEQENLSADSDEPVVPLRYRHAIVERALYFHYRDLKDDNRATQANASYVDLMLRITGDTEIGQSRPQFRPRISSYVRRARKPYSRRGGRHTVGSAFDELRDR